jgi:putative flippase GtrA
VILLLCSMAVSSAALALTLWLGGGRPAQALTLVAAWGLAALARFTLLRSWVFNDGGASTTDAASVSRR